MHDASVREHARELVQGGYSNSGAGDVVGVSGETIARWGHDGNWKIPKKPTLSPLIEKRLRILVLEGWSQSAVSRQLGIYHTKLGRLVKERGLEFGPKSKAYALSATLKKDKWKCLLTLLERCQERN